MHEGYNEVFVGPSLEWDWVGVHCEIEIVELKKR